MPNWKKLIVSGSDASLNSLNVTNNVTAQSFTGSFSGSVTAPGSTTQIVYNNNGILAATSSLVYSGSNVGIGISAPTERLHIVGSTSGNQFARITATDSDSSAAWVAQNDSGDNVVYRVFSSGVSGTQMGSALGRSASLLANLGGSGVFLLGTFSNTNFVLGTNNTERMRITNGGNVGIGTTSPAKTLVVNGETWINLTSDYFGGGTTVQISAGGTGAVGVQSNTFYLYPYSSNTATSLIYGYNGGGSWNLTNAGGSNRFDFYSYGGGITVMSLASSGNVGIGTTSPTRPLTVKSSNIGIRMDNSSNSNAGLEYYVSTGTFYNWLLGAQYNIANTFEITPSTTVGGTTYSTPAFVVNANGNVGIGTTSPSVTLDVNGSGIRITNATNPNVYLNNTTVQWKTYLVSGGSHNFAINDAVRDVLTLGYNGAASYFQGCNVGIGTSSPGYKLEVVGAVSASTYYGDGSNLTNIGSGSVSAAGSDGQIQYNNSGLFGGASNLYYNDSTNRVGIGISSPGYDLDVSGSARVQDRLRVGVVNSGNGVIHQSSAATINPSGATIVWSVPGSAGICAFIEYYVFNSNTGTSQRAGNIVTTWNAGGSPQITHTETTTPDVGSTTAITFTTTLTLGGDPQLVATNTSGDIWYMVMNYRYF